MSKETMTLNSLEFATYTQMKSYLKQIAEYDFSTRQVMEPAAVDLMAVLSKVYKENGRRVFSECFTHCQYFLMFPKRRSHIAMQLLEKPGDVEHVKMVFAKLVSAAVIRHSLLAS